MTLLPLPFNLSGVNQAQLPSLCNHVDLVCLDLTGLGRTFFPTLIFTNVVLLDEIKLERGSRKMMTRAESYTFPIAQISQSRSGIVCFPLLKE